MDAGHGAIHPIARGSALAVDRARRIQFCALPQGPRPVHHIKARGAIQREPRRGVPRVRTTNTGGLNRIKNAAREILSRMYEEASPPAEYPRQVEDYANHYLPMERQMQIMDEVCRELRISHKERGQINRSLAITLCTPSTEPITREG